MTDRVIEEPEPELSNQKHKIPKVNANDYE